MKREEIEKLNFFQLCAQEQLIDASKAPVHSIYVNKPDEIPNAAQAAYGPFPPETVKKWYVEYLRNKFKFFKNIENGASHENLLCDFNKSVLETKEQWELIFQLWKVQEPIEKKVYTLRIHQIKKERVIDTYYNSFTEFNEWTETFENNLSSEFKDMGSHFSFAWGLQKASFEKVSEAISFIIDTVADNTSLSEKKLLQAFTESIKVIFNCELCDYLVVDDNIVRLYATSHKQMESFGLVLGDSEHYKYGEGITGAVLLGDPSDKFFHVGTNCLAQDDRQSPWHTNAYETFYEQAFQNFWVFPIYKANRMVGAFRVIDKTGQTDEEKFWSYDERIQLLYIARWFQKFLNLVQKFSQENFAMAESCIVPDKHQLTTALKKHVSSWLNSKVIELVVEHLTYVVHRRMEKRRVGCCIIICKSDNLKNLFSHMPGYIIFNNSSDHLKKLNGSNVLENVAKSYKVILPTSGAFIFDEELQFCGVREFKNPVRIEDDEKNELNRITIECPSSVVFLIERERDSILALHNGKLKFEYYLSEYTGEWKCRSFFELLDIIERALRIQEQKESPVKPVIEKVYRAIWWLSYRKIGTMIVIVENETKKNECMEKGIEFHSIEKHINELLPHTFFDLAMLDGAILMDRNGQVYYGGVQFNHEAVLSEATRKKLEGKGTRHHQAAIIAHKLSDTIVFTVSENRGIGAFFGSEALFIDR